jgi:RND family efflux transporter MFP subunit
MMGVACLTVVLLGVVACGGTATDDGHTHGGDTHTHDGEAGASVTVTAWTDRAEIFAEHPPMIAGQTSGPWAIHVTDLDAHTPVAEGTLTLRFRRPDGAAYVHTANAPSSPGIFTPQPEIPEAGTFRLFAIVESPAVRDTVDLGDLRVYDSASQVPASEATAPEIAFTKEQQWETDFATVTAAQGSVATSVEAPGTIVPVAGRFAKVAAPVSGLTPARPNLDMPAPGDRVREGERLAVLTPSGSETSYAVMKARVDRLEREVRRAERLLEAEAIPRTQLVEARHDLEVARAALASMGGSSEGETTASSPSDFTYSLRAPLSGRVHERHLAPGSHVDVGTVLYTIVDPSRVWIRLRVPVEHASQAADATGGVFTVEGSATRHTADRVVSTGASIDAESRTLPVLLEADNTEGRLTIGMHADATLLLDTAEPGVVLPTHAIQREDGEPVAYVQTGGESFERRPLRLGPSDGTHTVVRRGVEAGEHVVTSGAYQVYLASLGSTEIGGHGHPH